MELIGSIMNYNGSLVQNHPEMVLPCVWLNNGFIIEPCNDLNIFELLLSRKKLA